MKILVVEDNPLDQEVISANLSDHELTMISSGEEALALENYVPDMVLLDINLPGVDGYETCRQLREKYCQQPIPVVFLTEMTGLDDRIRAFDVGGDDHLGKPCDKRLLRSKVSVYDKIRQRLQTSSEQADSAMSALMGLQAQSAKIQSISRFVQASMFCHDIHVLSQLFLRTAKEIGINCVLHIRCQSGQVLASTKGNVTVLETEIIERSESIGRIHQFGQQRALFRWPSATLLTLNVGDTIDILALFMDALDAAINAIESESKLVNRVNKLEEDNSLVSDQIADMFESMRNELIETLLSSSSVSAIDQDEQDKLNDLILNYGDQIREKLMKLTANNIVIKNLINQLRVPSDDIKKLISGEDDSGSLSSSVDLF